MDTVIFYKNNRRHSAPVEQFKRHHIPDAMKLFNPAIGALDHTYWHTKKGGRAVSVFAVI